VFIATTVLSFALVSFTSEQEAPSGHLEIQISGFLAPAAPSVIPIFVESGAGSSEPPSACSARVEAGDSEKPFRTTTESLPVHLRQPGSHG